MDELDPTARLWAARSASTTFARSARSSAIATSNALSDVRRLNASMQSPPVNLGVDLRISNLASSIMCLRTADISGSSLIFSGMPAGWLGKGRATPSRCEYRVRTTTVFPRGTSSRSSSGSTARRAAKNRAPYLATQVAAKPKSLARDNKTGCRSSGSASAPPRPAGQTKIISQNHEPRRRAYLGFACLVCRPLRCGDLGAILALTEWTTKRNEFRRQSHMLERTLMAFGMWP